MMMLLVTKFVRCTIVILLHSVKVTDPLLTFLYAQTDEFHAYRLRVVHVYKSNDIADPS